MSNFTFISKACELKYSDGASLQAEFASISDIGAVVKVADPFKVPDTLTLTVRRRERACRVMWRSNGQIGVTFGDDA